MFQKLQTNNVKAKHKLQTKHRLEYNGRFVIPCKIEFGKYIDECELIEAEWEDTNEPLTAEEYEMLHEDENFREKFESYIWSEHPDEYVLAMDQ